MTHLAAILDLFLSVDERNMKMHTKNSQTEIKSLLSRGEFWLPSGPFPDNKPGLPVGLNCSVTRQWEHFVLSFFSLWNVAF